MTVTSRSQRLKSDIERWLADEPVAALPESWSQRAARWTRRHRAWARAGAAALVLVTLVSVVAAGAVYQARGRAEKQRYRAECRLANSDLDRGLSFCEQGDAAPWVTLASSRPERCARRRRGPSALHPHEPRILVTSMLPSLALSGTRIRSHCRGLQPRRQDRRSPGAATRRRGSGTRRPASPSASR